MPPNIKVCVNGFVLSTLLFDCANNSGDQEGFLYGSVTRNVRREINDLSMSGTQEDIHISICSSVPCGSILSFYGNNGQVNGDDLDFNIGDRKKNIIGWYRYRRYSAMYPSSREIAVHQNLKQVFDIDMDMGSQYFVYAVLTSSNLPNFATHSYDYAFFTQRQNKTFRHLNTTILNLGDTRNSYRAGSMALPFMNSSSFNSVLSSSWNLHSFYEIEDQIQHFHQRLRSKLESLQEELAASDAVNGTLEDDIRHLSNEMQSLLATQEQLSSAASLSSASHPIAVNEADASDIRPKELSRLKRAAVDPVVPDVSVKRVCLDKYFESGEYQDEKSSDNTITDSIDIASDLSPKDKDDNQSSSQLLVVDPDNGETSSVSQNEAESDKSEVATTEIKDVNMVPSPSSTVEVVTSNSGESCYIDAEDREESRSCSSSESTDVKESSSEPTSPKEVDTTNPVVKMTVTTETELQSETISSAVNDPSDNSVEFETNVLSETSTVVAGASSSSDELPKKMIPPFIIYASKESEDQSEDPSPSSSTEKCSELNEAKHVESHENTSNDSSKEPESEVAGSPTTSTPDQSNEDTSASGDLGKKN